MNYEMLRVRCGAMADATAVAYLPSALRYIKLAQRHIRLARSAERSPERRLWMAAIADDVGRAYERACRRYVAVMTY